MSTPIDSEQYFEIEVVKENINEVGNATTETQLQNWGDESDCEIDTKLIYLFTTFPLTEALVIADGFTANVWKQIRQLSNARLEAKFWLKTNSDGALMDKSDESIEEFRVQLTQISLTTE